jgi:23S rRNA pseudouridine1911/1915/1917 synthase
MEEKHILPVHLPRNIRRIRLDHYLNEYFPDLSRSRIKRLIRDGFVLVDDIPAKAGYFLRGEETVRITIPEPEDIRVEAEYIPLSITYEDRDLIVIEKPAGMVVHPARGHRSGTLVNAVLAHCRGMKGDFFDDQSRPGIVHRLDKNTSGLIVVAKNPESQFVLSEEFKQRKIKKIYRALVWGNFRTEEGVIEEPVARHGKDRKKMAVRRDRTGKVAITRWCVIRQFRRISHVQVALHTGRTHQIRVHFQHINHSIVGDSDYGGGISRVRNFTGREVPFYRDLFTIVRRQLLHACRIGLYHPSTMEYMEFVSEPPEDFARTLTILENAEAP